MIRVNTGKPCVVKKEPRQSYTEVMVGKIKYRVHVPYATLNKEAINERQLLTNINETCTALLKQVTIEVNNRPLVMIFHPHISCWVVGPKMKVFSNFQDFLEYTVGLLEQISRSKDYVILFPGHRGSLRIESDSYQLLKDIGEIDPCHRLWSDVLLQVLTRAVEHQDACKVVFPSGQVWKVVPLGNKLSITRESMSIDDASEFLGNLS